jgi:hypothetical protein
MTERDLVRPGWTSVGRLPPSEVQEVMPSEDLLFA